MKLLNKQYRLISCLLFSSFFAMLILVTSNYVFSTILLRTNTLSEMLYYINNIGLLKNVFIVRLVLNMSDMNVSLIKIMYSISFVSVVSIGLLLLVFDLCKYNRSLLLLRKYIRITFSLILIKYFILILLVVFNYSTYMNPVPLFNVVAFISFAFDTLCVFSCIITIRKYVMIVRK